MTDDDQQERNLRAYASRASRPAPDSPMAAMVWAIGTIDALRAGRPGSEVTPLYSGGLGPIPATVRLGPDPDGAHVTCLLQTDYVYSVNGAIVAVRAPGTVADVSTYDPADPATETANVEVWSAGQTMARGAAVTVLRMLAGQDVDGPELADAVTSLRAVFALDENGEPA